MRRFPNSLNNVRLQGMSLFREYWYGVRYCLKQTLSQDCFLFLYLP